MRSVYILLLSIFISARPSAMAQLPFFKKLADSAFVLSRYKVQYDLTYYKITYPMGDIPANKGVCTDVIIRAYRKLGIDLQQEVHEDMRHNFQRYPKYWGLKTTDRNIDHRRVPNLMQFFSRKGTVLPVSTNAHDYRPGDIVCWNIKGGTNHIGLVVDQRSADGKRYLIVHNIGNGQVIEDCLFTFTIIGHFRYLKE